MALSDTAIRNAKPQAKPFKVFDAGGLFLIATPAGGKWWRLRYTMDGKEKLLSLGTYPDTSLAEARERRDKARRLLADGIDPGQQRKEDHAKNRQFAENSFEQIARNWPSLCAAASCQRKQRAKEGNLADLELDTRKLVHDSGLGLIVTASASLPAGRWYLLARPATQPTVAVLR